MQTSYPKDTRYFNFRCLEIKFYFKRVWDCYGEYCLTVSLVIKAGVCHLNNMFIVLIKRQALVN